MGALHLFAPAKVNLVLEVLGQRPDGYHEIASVFAPLDFGDFLTLTLLEEPVVRLHVRGHAVPAGKENLAVRAALLLRERFGRRGGVRIDIEKRIPVGAGLGGGSSDAAAVLRGLNILWELGIPSEELAALGAELGSDVPYFLWDGFAWVGGRGERVEPFLPQGESPYRLLLVKPRASLATKDVFLRFRSRGFSRSDGSRSRKLREALCAGDWEALPELAANDLEGAAVDLLPEIAAVRETLKELGACAAFLTGSGPTYVGLFRGGEELSRAREALTRELPFVREATMVVRPFAGNTSLRK
ncbi:4-(cytidine 5'-diphospho)-2-C-methyl-D-erythritol kinase [Brockia lithotrophica]|uniref:4-diphosphocytidyl-2-C-methyl-D-erythritol kinase n=1 Tax=Brockia lithotrophica TaxID=933949 RepID=A0A660KW51_9BACL|nr:4-(cytidine 5'-diphospho)-2-C-methyl-D-erythritol kinase [Brockia lithotrophica]RKQ85636.1 4-diphosphocytidyl-2-C-methyl-D-erythritol kinase [Brockia lithotrophica]